MKQLVETVDALSANLTALTNVVTTEFPDPGSQATPAGKTCADVKGTKSGNYYIGVDGSGYLAYCDMERLGGGWTLVATKLNPNFVLWSSNFDTTCAQNLGVDCASSAAPYDWTVAMWRFQTTDIQVVFQAADQANIKSFINGQVTAHQYQSTSLTKYVHGIQTTGTISKCYIDDNNGISESHSEGSDRWIDVWALVDQTNNYISSDDASKLNGVKCLGGYCKTEPILLFVR
jgi:hypothetical protein